MDQVKMRRRKNSNSSSSSSSSIDSSSSNANDHLQLGLAINSQQYYYSTTTTTSTSLFVKVYMEGIPIGRKLDLMAHHGYRHLITTLDHMFNTTILWAEGEDGEYSMQKSHHHHHVLTYGDSEGDWMIVGDVPWEMFLSSVKRLKISRRA